jgi:hypothetical protein
MVVLKPRLSLPIGLVLAGVLLGYVGWRVVQAFGTDGAKAFPFGLLGVLMAGAGALSLTQRGRATITIDASGIDLPLAAFVSAGSNLAEQLAERSRAFEGGRRLRIPREDIARVAKHASLRGRLIEVTRRSRESVLIQARHYCGLDAFLAHCRAEGLPVEGA